MSGIGGGGVTAGTGTGQIALSSGAVTVGTNNDKTGYSLTAGSYVLHASNNQRASITITSPATSNTAIISSVTTTRARLAYLGDFTNATTTGNDENTNVVLTNATTVTATRNGTGGNTTTSFEVEETF